MKKVQNNKSCLKADFRASQGGTVAILFALAVVPLILIAGSAVDYVHSVDIRTDLQRSLDGAALAAVSPYDASDADREQIALDYLATNFAETPKNALVSVEEKTVTVSADVVVPTAFMTLVGISQMIPSASATATKDQGQPVCILSLDPTSRAAIEIQGSVDFEADDCVVQANSNHQTGLDSHTNSVNPAIADGFCVAGGYTGVGFSPMPQAHCPVVEDPFTDIQWPVFSGCDETNLIIKKTTQTLHPGTYCGGLRLSVDADVTFAAGTYVIRDGPFVVASQASAHGENAVFVLTGNNTSIQLNSGADIDLDAPESGDYVGILFAQHPASNPGGESDIQGGSSMSIVGSIYLPTQKLDLGGGGDLSIVGAHTPVVAHQLAFRGNSVNVSINPNLFPGSDRVAKANEIVRLIK